MQDTRSFREILESKLKDLPRQDHATNPVYVEPVNPFDILIASLLKTPVNRKAPSKSDIRKYPRPTSKAERPTLFPLEKLVRLSPRPGEKVILARQLTSQGRSALDRMIELGAEELKETPLLSESIVKRVFRRLALRWHPDRNPKATGREFHALIEAQRALLESLRA